MNSKDKLDVVLEDEDDAEAAIILGHNDDEEEADADEDNNDDDAVEDDTVSVVKELENFVPPRRKPSVESNFRRMSTLSSGNGGFASHPVRRGRRRAVTTSDHAKMCALVQTRLKLGDIM